MVSTAGISFPLLLSPTGSKELRGSAEVGHFSLPISSIDKRGLCDSIRADRGIAKEKAFPIHRALCQRKEVK